MIIDIVIRVSRLNPIHSLIVAKIKNAAFMPYPKGDGSSRSNYIIFG
jgi:hypothetical protein